jgi:hypothetical protein
MKKGLGLKIIFTFSTFQEARLKKNTILMMTPCSVVSTLTWKLKKGLAGFHRQLDLGINREATILQVNDLKQVQSLAIWWLRRTVTIKDSLLTIIVDFSISRIISILWTKGKIGSTRQRCKKFKKARAPLLHLTVNSDLIYAFFYKNKY